MTNWWTSISLNALWSPTNTSGALSQSPSDPLAAEDSRQNVLHDAAADEGTHKEHTFHVPRSSTQNVAIAMSSAEDTRTQGTLWEYTNPPAGQQTIKRTRVPDTIFPGATLLDGAGSRRTSTDVVLKKSNKSQSTRSNEHEESLLLSATRGRLQRGLTALIDKHTEVLAARVNTEEWRTKLKMRRQALGELDTKYMLEMEKYFENNSAGQVANLKHNFGKLQLAKTEILALEEEYEEEATRLVQSEAELRDLESKMYRKLAESPVNSIGQLNKESPEGDQAEREPSETDVAEWDRIEQSPEVRAYRSQLGYVNMLRERLIDRDTQYVQVTEEHALREEIGLQPEEDTEEFLASFEAERELLDTQLRDAESVLANLAANLQERGNLPIRGNPFADLDRPDGPSREHSLFGKDDYYDDEAVERHGLANEDILAAAAALLLSQEDSQLVYADVITDTDGISIDKASYINSWQLHRLRKSVREVARLIQEQKAAGIQLSPEHLKLNVLETWMHDETTRCSDLPHFEIQARDLSMAAHSDASRHSKPASVPTMQAWQTSDHLIQRRLSNSHAETTRW